MRDVKRIQKTLDMIKKIWLKYPDLRLCQLLENVKPSNLNDMYYIEDEDLVKLLHSRYDIERSNND